MLFHFQEVDAAALVGSTQAYLSDAKDGAATATKYDQEQEQVHGKANLYAWA